MVLTNGSSLRLDFSIAGFSIDIAGEDDTVLDTKCTTQAEDEALVEAWEYIINNIPKIVQIFAYLPGYPNNCITLSKKIHKEW